MAEQDYVQIPNETTVGVTGSPINAQIACDDSSGAGTGPFIQQMSLANIAAELREMVNILGRTFSESNDPTGRLRILLDAATGNITLGTVTASNVTTLGSAAIDASDVPYDLNAVAWHNYRNNVIS